MRLLRQKGHKCVLYSAAMVLDEEPNILEAEIGHDGLEKIYNLPEPKCLRGHHMQEILDCFVRRGKGLMLVEAMPRSGPQGYPDKWHLIFQEEFAEHRFKVLLRGRRAILLGLNPETKANHAYAWDGHQVFDPLGRKPNFDEVPLREAWIVVSL